jgi:hypothetical protein
METTRNDTLPTVLIPSEQQPALHLLLTSLVHLRWAISKQASGRERITRERKYVLQQHIDEKRRNDESNLH